RMELYDDPDSPDIVATFELPGIKTSDLSITVRQGMLSMDVDASQSAQTRKPEARHFPVHELRYGPFRRVVQLPTNADTSCINASLSDGMLSVSWPR
ncbi:HSP20-like chaperone, partial [Mycena rosella]